MPSRSRNRNAKSWPVVGTGHYERNVREIAAAGKVMDLLGVNAYGDIPLLAAKE